MRVSARAWLTNCSRCASVRPSASQKYTEWMNMGYERGVNVHGSANHSPREPIWKGRPRGELVLHTARMLETFEFLILNLELEVVVQATPSASFTPNPASSTSMILSTS